jgi:hypothetical protein
MKITITINTDRFSRRITILYDIGDSKPLMSGVVYDSRANIVGTLRVTNLTKKQKAIIAKYKKEFEGCV